MQTVIFLNGEIPGNKIIRKILKKRSLIISADGGGNYLKSEGIFPNVVIGDLDSITPSALKYFREKGSEIIKIKEQETTDFEKSLRYCIQKKLKSIVVLGAAGLRPDHTVNNLSILKRYCNCADIRIITEEFEMFMTDKNIEFKYRPGNVVSFIAMPAAVNITTSGLKYKLRGEDLEFGKREGSLNVSTSGIVRIKFDKGFILIIKKHFL